jgi:hypothetical protein
MDNSAMTVMIFILGALLGVLGGGALCVRYMRHAILADIGPTLRRIRLQIDNLESAINLALVTRYNEMELLQARERPRRPS